MSQKGGPAMRTTASSFELFLLDFEQARAPSAKRSSTGCGGERSALNGLPFRSTLFAANIEFSARRGI